MFELRTESASSIMDKYLTEAVRIFETRANETGCQVMINTNWFKQTNSEWAVSLVVIFPSKTLWQSVFYFYKVDLCLTQLFQAKMVEAYANLAKFCDDQHQQLWNYMQSKDFEDKQNLMAQIREESNSM